MSVAAVAMDVPAPESQRLIAVSLGKIAASRGQKGGINLHKNLLVATVLHKARTAYMIQQHMNAAKQRVAAAAATTTTTTTPTTASTLTTQQPQAVEMKDQSHHRQSEQPAATSPSSPSSATTTTSAVLPVVAAAAPTFLTPLSPSQSAAPVNKGSVSGHQTAARPERGSAVSDSGADGSNAMQVAEDKENTPPPPSKDATNAPTFSLDCEKRLQLGGSIPSTMDSAAKEPLSSSAVMSHAQQQQSTRDNVTSALTSCSSCVLKRRRATDRDNENVSAPKVRILDCRLSSSSKSSSNTTDNSSVVINPHPEPMQCDSPQISSLVNIFNSSFSGLSGTAAADMSVRCSSAVGQSILSSVTSHSHKLSENLTCAKEMKFGLDSVHQPIALSV